MKSRILSQRRGFINIKVVGVFLPTVVKNCPRCRAQMMTFDVVADVYLSEKYDWASCHEAFCICRRCQRPSILKISLSDHSKKKRFLKNNSLCELQNDLEPIFRTDGWLDVSAIEAAAPPESVPECVKLAFVEGARCYAVGCYNAAAAMFRLCLDLATKGLLPVDDDGSGPSKHERRNLAPRIKWLLDRQLLSADLAGLSTAVKENGDDGAHEGSLTDADAADLLDFASALLNRLYSEPARISVALERRAKRRP
jgi:hypothetical protein